MKGIILHGGHGTRLRPLTHTGPKQLLPIANKPMSQYALEDLRNVGIYDIAIVIGDIYPEKVKECYGNGKEFGVNITYIYQEKPQGISHAIRLCKEFVGDDKFIVYLGDNVLRKNLSDYTKKFSSSGLDAMILLCEVDNPSKFGVAYIDKENSLLKDQIQYDFPMDPFGSIFGGRYTRHKLNQMFAYRRNVTKNDLYAQSKYKGKPLDIVVTGGSGLIGSELIPFLTTAGHGVKKIVRGRPKKGELSWNIERGIISNLNGKDAVVHLAGESINKPIGGKIPIPWTKWKKKEILDSRVKGTKLIAEHLASLPNPPKVLVCASAVGYYGDNGDNILSEDTP